MTQRKHRPSTHPPPAVGCPPPAGSAENSGGPTFATDRNFTGQKRDGTDLLYYNARYYDPTLGIFLSPDTIVPEPTLTIDYNRYVYARANPLKYSDPSGHCVFAAAAGSGGISSLACGGGGSGAVGAGLVRAAAGVIATGTAAALVIDEAGVGNRLRGVEPVAPAPPLAGFPLNGREKSVVQGVPLADHSSDTIVTTPADVDTGPIIDVFPRSIRSPQDLIYVARLRKAMGLTDTGVQAHHVIPTAKRDHQLVRLAEQAGWQHDAAYNGIALPQHDAIGRMMGLPSHRGPHKEYSNRVERLMDAAYRPGMTSQQAKYALFKLTMSLKYELHLLPRGQKLE